MFGPQSEPVTLSRDCPAILVPSGDHVNLPAGSNGLITQALGGSFTVFVDGNLFRVSGRDGDALGKAAQEAPRLPEDATEADLEAAVWSQLKNCYDPEIPVNIVDLGLVYECAITPQGKGGHRVDIKMTLTAPGCGMGEVLVEDVRDRLLGIPTVKDVDVELVFDPPWDYSRMSESARLETGLM